MKAANKTVWLRGGQVATCDCCGAELRKCVIETAIGKFGRDCFGAIRRGALYLRNCSNAPDVYGRTRQEAELHLRKQHKDASVGYMIKLASPV